MYVTGMVKSHSRLLFVFYTSHRCESSLLNLNCVSFLENFFHEAAYNGSSYQMVHLSDALRVLLVWKFGGLYLDLDYIVLNDMSHYQNFLASNGGGVTNNAFSFSPGHSFLNKLINKMPDSYSTKCWNCIGPRLFTKCLKEYQMNKSQAEDLPVLPLKRYLSLSQNFDHSLLDSSHVALSKFITPPDFWVGVQKKSAKILTMEAKTVKTKKRTKSGQKWLQIPLLCHYTEWTFEANLQLGVL